MNNNLELAIKAALDAGKAIMQVYNSVFEVDFKDDNSPLTLADRKANDIINSYLTPTGIPIISEENKQLGYDVRKNWKECWIVDPVDGTKEFIKRNGEFTVNIALVRDGMPELGVIYVPAEKTIYVSQVSTELAFKVALSTHRFNLEEVYSKRTFLTPSLGQNKLIKVVGSRSHMNSETLSYIEGLKNQGKKTQIVSKGSSLKFCLIAEGKADVYPRFAPTMEWDTAAGQALCNALGIEVISQETLEPLLYNKQNLLNPWFLVSKNNICLK